MSVTLMGMVFNSVVPPITVTIEGSGGKRKKKIQSSTLKMVLLCMANSANDDGSSAYQSRTTIAKKTGLSESAVNFCVKALLATGYIKYDGVSKHGTSDYSIDGSLLHEEHKTRYSSARSSRDKSTPQRGVGYSSARSSGTPQRGVNSSSTHPLPERMITQAVKDYCAAFQIESVTALQAQKINAAHDHNPAHWPEVMAWAARSDVSAPGRILSAAIKWQPQRSNGNGTSTWRNSNHATGGAGVRHPGGSSNAPTPAEVERDRELAKRKRANRVR